MQLEDHPSTSSRPSRRQSSRNVSAEPCFLVIRSLSCRQWHRGWKEKHLYTKCRPRRLPTPLNNLSAPALHLPPRFLLCTTPFVSIASSCIYGNVKQGQLYVLRLSGMCSSRKKQQQGRFVRARSWVF
ncbi:hypothetical protein BCR35DRAFT_301032 [Leucosporidium creatinivorum]|uniref:Uncharacterized protein n=1 Tax=Leucosporidium creatinivorum TaxID=106004 RepID=A0A1Y2FZS7_9BASI|nr:hypothetical protein BCR35DRAFT_301032 [Leucosporidium creatinivorum]